MTNFARSRDAQIDRADNAAIRREIGNAFRIALNAERLPLTPRLSSLMDRLAEQDRRDADPEQHRG
jgi:hypothetical protein